MENKISSLTCQNCGVCCRDFPFVEVNDAEMTALEKYTKLSRYDFTEPRGASYDDGHFLKTKENGDCMFLKVDNGYFTCGVYEARAGICRNYPVHEKHWKWCNENRVE
ncbi:YkgJ family cysteine cluster protein [Carboxylicivirga sp. M1479]|uniref:YkgJ family cysteine cluster protein n=1 Tax=Carboxylicivirga sp. M1479 TaxID=2594476 RepID=UPI00163DA6A0|nr:YkgJ family cysteine cluster protein [Carboxylicivirga sp. M1479]